MAGERGEVAVEGGDSRRWGGREGDSRRWGGRHEANGLWIARFSDITVWWLDGESRQGHWWCRGRWKV